jgi:hypothetical protein
MWLLCFVEISDIDHFLMFRLAISKRRSKAVRLDPGGILLENSIPVTHTFECKSIDVPLAQQNHRKLKWPRYNWSVLSDKQGDT